MLCIGRDGFVQVIVMDHLLRRNNIPGIQHITQCILKYTHTHNKGVWLYMSLQKIKLHVIQSG